MIRRQFSYYGNSWIGMFIAGNDSVAFIPVDALDVVKKTIEHYLKTRVIKTTIAQSNLLGLYVAMNNNGIILPNIATEEEAALFRSLGLNVYLSRERHNAHGNNIAVNNLGGVINPAVSGAERKKIADVLGVELVPAKIASYATVGSACIVSDRGFLAHYQTTDEELKSLEEVFRVRGERGTMNTGSGFVAYGAAANKNGYVAGELSTAFELGQLVKAMDFVDAS